MIKNKPLIRPVILCGGSGTRLWPESRSNYPKQFLPFSNDKNLFQLTLERFSNKELFSKPVIVTNKDYKFYIKNILNAQKIDASLILEPSSRGTTASIYIVTQLLSKNEILFIVPSDHLIQNQKYFEQKLLTILSDFHKDYLITFGIKPKYPSTAYGYLKVSAEINNFKHYLKVEKFLEKPKLDNAKKYAIQHLKSSEYKVMLGDDIYNEYFKFAICRNPYNRIKSEYFWCKIPGIGNKHGQSFDDFIKFVQKCVLEKNYYETVYHDHFMPQHEFIYDEKNNLQIDRLFKYENYDEVKIFLKEELNITYVPHLLKRRKNSDIELTDKQKEIIYEIYKKDFILLNYKK